MKYSLWSNVLVWELSGTFSKYNRKIGRIVGIDVHNIYSVYFPDYKITLWIEGKNLRPSMYDQEKIKYSSENAI